jgi:hypothetical protein
MPMPSSARCEGPLSGFLDRDDALQAEVVEAASQPRRCGLACTTAASRRRQERIAEPQVVQSLAADQAAHADGRIVACGDGGAAREAIRIGMGDRIALRAGARRGCR